VHVKPIATGTVTLTATSEGQTGHLTFTIAAGTGGGGGGGGGSGTGAVATVTITPGSVNAAVNDSIGMFAQPRNAAGQTLSGRVVTFTTSDSTVVSIMGAFGQSVILRSKKAGTSTITATSEGKSGTATVTVH
jgi:hypothetical protein